MFKYLTTDKYNELLLSFNLVNSSDIKKVNKILYGISNNIDSNYEEIIIKKKKGGLRFLNEPSKTLKQIQKNILSNVLVDRITSRYATAYKRKHSLTTNALPHVNKKIILKLDIENFFDNINFIKVYKYVFNECLYPKKLGFLLTNLCLFNNKLPQGAPTSGYISNLVLRNFDEAVGKFCNSKNISYTRYSDDMTFSGDFNVKEVISFVSKLLFEEGFKLNKSKIKVVNKGTRQQITGVVVNEKLTIRKNYKRKIRQEVYYVKRYGVDSHLNKIGIKDKTLYLRKLLGKINFVLQVESNNKEFINYKNYLIKNVL